MSAATPVSRFRVLRRLPFAVAVFYFCAVPARAEVKYNAALVPGVALERDRVVFDGSIVGAALFGEPKSSAWSLGPRVEVGTYAFNSLRGALGPALALPLEPLSLGLSAHVGAIRARGDSAIGVGARGFLGLRPYNHYGPYTATGGLILGFDHWFGLGTSVSLAAQLDVMWLSLPILALGELFRG